ncbi:MAG: hypothetical protein ACI9MR_001956, partial [Myxococcota bacterium]
FVVARELELLKTVLGSEEALLQGIGDKYRYKAVSCVTSDSGYHSKLCALSFALELARRPEGSGVVVNRVRVPPVHVGLDRLPNVPKWQLGIYKLKRRFSLTPHAMAKSYAWLALADDAETLNGTYVDEGQRPAGTPNARGRLRWRPSCGICRPRSPGLRLTAVSTAVDAKGHLFQSRTL